MRRVPGPHGFRARHRAWGDTFVSCLLMIVIVLGGTIWAYFHFFQNRELVNAGTGYTVMKEDNRESDLAYQRAMRETLLTKTKDLVTKVNKFYLDTKGGKYKGDKSGFEQRYHETVQLLRDSINDLNARQVPAKFDKGQKQLCLSHKDLYDACLLVYKAYFEDEEPTLQKQHYKEAHEAVVKGWKKQSDGESIVRRNFG